MDGYPNWFNMTARANFDRYLMPFAGMQNYRALQIGAYVGHATEWMCRNVVNGFGARIDDVDTWLGSDEPAHKAFDWDTVLEAYANRVLPYVGTRVFPFQMTSDAFFHGTNAQDHYPSISRDIHRFPDTYDFVYIDGDHTAKQVLIDAFNAWEWLRVGGIMAFDDYTWSLGKGPEYDPRTGIDHFLDLRRGCYDLMAMNSQVWIMRTAGRKG